MSRLQKSSPRQKKIFFTSLFCLAFILSVAFSAGVIKSKQQHKKFEGLKKEISLLGEKYNFRYAYAIKDLGIFGTRISRFENEVFPAASIIKLPVLASALLAVSDGHIGLNDKIIIEREDIVGGSGLLKAKKFPYELTFQELLELMISVSDNSATNKVIDLLGKDTINKYFKKLGFKDTVLIRAMMDFSKRNRGIENYTSVEDILVVLEKIYKGELVNRKISDIALDFLKKQKVNTRIPRYLPSEVEVAHKTGLERGVVHDAGIVYASKGDYIICVLTKGVGSYTRAKKFIAELSLLTYNLYRQKETKD
ncbi:MAG: serine hydrolase [Candidatus Omnitrophica bacterium]|nr:serine hydrolase [Candidatus Omnitrophota bacterium]MBD3268755.1 serine hydrolase [Candidatus Omnitrophota bacterium]